jgi:signal transduction histidine kinase
MFAGIEKNVMQEARLIDDLLDLTRIASGKLSLQLQTLEFDAAVNEAVDSLQSRAAEKKIELRRRLAAGDARVRGDGVRLHQVLANILGNAVKFTPERGIIMVTTRLNHAQNLASVEIADSGIGMTAEEVARIFERFAQGDHAREASRSRYGGLGLGLAIARSLAELHGGGIAATSAGVGRGSVFTIWLPLESGEGGRTA